MAVTSDLFSQHPMPPLKRVSSVDAVVAVLRDQIFSGHLPSGVPLREAFLSEQLNVSRHTIRVALSNLAHGGIVTLETNRGAYVRTLTRADIVDCYRLRSLLELHAVEKLSGCPEKLAEARRALDELNRAGRDGDWAASREADLEFHRQLIVALGSPRILSTYESLLNELRLCFLIEGFRKRDHLANAREHEHLLALITDGNGVSARTAFESHLNDSCRAALDALDTHR